MFWFFFSLEPSRLKVIFIATLGAHIQTYVAPGHVVINGFSNAANRTTLVQSSYSNGLLVEFRVLPIYACRYVIRFDNR